MNALLRHRGPDGEGTWEHPSLYVGLAHRRLSIIDLETGAQPMSDGAGNVIVFNGEIYDYLELREELGAGQFRTTSDTEVVLAAYRKWGRDCVTHLRGMFAFAIWDERAKTLFCARDRFGIKPLYFVTDGGIFRAASEAKALLPFMPSIETDVDALHDYLTFQFCLHGKTLFKGVQELPAAHWMTVVDGRVRMERYWEVEYEIDYDHTERYFAEHLRARLEDSVAIHLRSDVPVGAYVSGGVDSGVVVGLASGRSGSGFQGFNGKFAIGDEFDESRYARDVADKHGFTLHETDIVASDFTENIRKVIYHLDFPVAGPGSFPQYIVSRLASKHVKVALGGQGGDEIFGGYTRYLIAYFEQCIKAAIDGTSKNGNFVVTYESIIPNLVSLRNYKSLLKEFWRDGLFDDLDKRYFRLINRAPDLSNEIRWEAVGSDYSPYESFRSIFLAKNVKKESYFDSMTHFDFKTLLPALLHVEDRMSMAHGLESRVPFVDHRVVEFAATMPSNVKFKDGSLKHVLKETMGAVLPESIVRRQDKMGFPVPLHSWFQGELREFVREVLGSQAALTRPYTNNAAVIERIDREPRFGRTIWGLLSLELWQQEFHDQAARFRAALTEEIR